jgi:hypothetical protein
MDISAEVPFDAETLVEDIIASATVNEAEGYVTGLDSSIINAAMIEYRAQVEEYMSTQQPDATVGDVLGMKTIRKQNFPMFMGTLPYKLSAMGSRYAELPSSDRHKLSFSVTGGDLYSFADPLSASYSLPEIAGKKITLSYSPATAEDEAVINSYLPEPHPDGTPIDPSELPSSLPAYLINLKPELRIDGVVVATGGAVQMGVAEKFNMTFHDPAHSSDVIRNVIDAGEYFGIAVDVGRISKDMMESVKARLESTKAKLEAEDFTGLTKDELLGDLLYTTAMTYFAELDAFDFVKSRTMGVNDIRFPSEAIFKTSLEVEESFGVPVSAAVGSLSMDVDRILSLTKAKDADNKKKLNFIISSGMNSSALEHRVPEQMFSTSENSVEGVSAVKVIQLAAVQGIPIYTVTKNNVSKVIPQLQLDAVVINEILNAVNAGKEVTVSKTDINFHGWIGAGYIITDPTTGAGAYMISGGENGSEMNTDEMVDELKVLFVVFAGIASIWAAYLSMAALYMGLPVAAAVGGILAGIGIGIVLSQVFSEEGKEALEFMASSEEFMITVLTLLAVTGASFGTFMFVAVILALIASGVASDIRKSTE